MSAQRLHFGVKNRENGRPEFPINVPMFQPNSKILFARKVRHWSVYYSVLNLFTG